MQDDRVLWSYNLTAEDVNWWNGGELEDTDMEKFDSFISEMMPDMIRGVISELLYLKEQESQQT